MITRSSRVWLAALVAIAGTFVALTLISNVLSLRIVTVAGLSLDAGTLTFPLTFLARDLLHKVGGKYAARAAIGAAAVLNLVMAGSIWLTAHMPADPLVGPQDGFAEVLSPAWRIVAASIVAQVVSELADTEVYSAWVRRFGERFPEGRVLASNAVSVPIDSAVFTLVAFAGVLPTASLAGIAFGMLVVKFGVSVLFAPLIRAVPVRPDLRAAANMPA